MNSIFHSAGSAQRRIIAASLAAVSQLVPPPAVRAASAPQIISFASSGALAWTNAIVPGVSTVETSATLNSSNWSPTQNAFSIVSTGGVTVAVDTTNKFFRLRTVDVSATGAGFTNLVQSYGLLETIAGRGDGRVDGTSYWLNSFEGGAATNAALSRPHYAMADRAGNIYIVDKDSHSVLRVDTNGLIHTHAGTHTGGYNGDGPDLATNLQLNYPNGLWVRADGTVYVLDSDNGRVRRVATNGVMTTLFYATSDASALSGGRMLWVKDDESLAYFGATTKLRKWTPSDGLSTLIKGFTELGTFCVEADGSLTVCDRGGSYVYHVTSSGTQSIVAGNGTASGGGNGYPALQTGLYGVRGVWPVPTGGHLLLCHDGCQLWYLDTADTNYILLNGATGTTHSGDGAFFYDPSALKISEGRSVTMDADGNILVCESDYGYVRRIRFHRMNPAN
jgi:hypothetical protein